MEVKTRENIQLFYNVFNMSIVYMQKTTYIHKVEEGMKIAMIDHLPPT